MVEARHHPGGEFLRPVVVARRPLDLRLRLRNDAARLGDGGVGAPGGGVVLGEERVELGAVETGEHLAGGDMVAVLGVQFDDREAVDARGDLGLLARNERAGDEQALDELAPRGGRDADRRRRRRGRSLGRQSASRAVGRADRQAERARLHGRRRAGLKRGKAPSGGDKDDQRSEDANDTARWRRFSADLAESPLAQGLEQFGRPGGLYLRVELRFERQAFHQAAHVSEEEQRDGAPVDRRRRFAALLGKRDEALELAEDVGVDGTGDGGDRRVARRLRPDFDDQAHLWPRPEADMLAKTGVDGGEDVLDFGEPAEVLDPFLLVALAETLDDRFLGREGAVEITGAHAGGFRHMLHGGGVEPVLGEGALRRIEDAPAPLAIGRPAVTGRRSYQHDCL